MDDGQTAMNTDIWKRKLLTAKKQQYGWWTNSNEYGHMKKEIINSKETEHGLTAKKTNT